MKRINDRTVELTEAEQEVKDQFDLLLDQGWGIPQAAVQVLSEHWKFGRPCGGHERTARRAFVAWLSDDSVVALTNGGYTIKVGYRS